MHIGSGKNNKLLYYLRGFAREAVPDGIFRRRLRRALASVEDRPDRDYIFDRVNYYCRLEVPTELPATAPTLGEHSRKGAPSVYYFDTKEYTRWFDPRLRWEHRFGDVTFVPEVPAIVKSRPIGGDNANSVLLNLDKVRHFTFLKDTVPFREKSDRAVFRGHIGGKPHRRRFMEMYYGSEVCDCGIIPSGPGFPAEWLRPKISLWEHLRYKFVMALEGNDVASNLKWIMSSASLAVMPKPKYETWFMEGRLEPGRHYVEIRDDYSDLPEKIAYYSAHPEAAEEIIRCAHEYVGQFFDRRRERLIALSVLDKYFRMTGQTSGSTGSEVKM
ncbi:glycosyl transferase family 90 [uncultured Rikenella sp.]|uniref:glycosyl transferase family 90 n=1 Tax=uncultured Rikenella sp. TaxID=368003 RepID=UPI00260D1140|nr:glycosyl transferase family 90 [uncultured Rikenella sp.]